MLHTSKPEFQATSLSYLSSDTLMCSMCNTLVNKLVLFSCESIFYYRAPAENLRSVEGKQFLPYILLF